MHTDIITFVNNQIELDYTCSTGISFIDYNTKKNYFLGEKNLSKALNWASSTKETWLHIQLCYCPTLAEFNGFFL